jgi:hypothetical protein
MDCALDLEEARFGGKKIDRKARLAAYGLQKNDFLVTQAVRLFRWYPELAVPVLEGTLRLPTNPATWAALKKKAEASAEPAPEPGETPSGDRGKSETVSEPVIDRSLTLPDSEEERTRYEELKETARKGMDTFYRVGIALREIRDAKLYRLDGYASFEAFVRAEFDLSKPRAYQLIEAASTVEILAQPENSSTSVDVSTSESSPETSTTVDISLPNERQARELSGLKPEEKCEVWKQAVVTAPEGKVTFEHVRETRTQMTGRKAPRKRSPLSLKSPESECRSAGSGSSATEPGKTIEPKVGPLSERIDLEASHLECIADKLSPFGAELPAVPLSGSVRAAMVKGLGNKAEALRRVAQELHGYAKLCEEGERRL